MVGARGIVHSRSKSDCPVICLIVREGTLQAIGKPPCAYGWEQPQKALRLIRCRNGDTKRRKIVVLKNTNICSILSRDIERDRMMCVRWRTSDTHRMRGVSDPFRSLIVVPRVNRLLWQKGDGCHGVRL
jgi:hypothetical protein